MEVLVCYEDEGVYIDTYGRITKETVLQWGEMPASVGEFMYIVHTHPINTCRLCVCVCVLSL